MYIRVHHKNVRYDLDGLVQERCNSSAIAMELRLSCTKPSIYMKWQEAIIESQMYFLHKVYTLTPNIMYILHVQYITP